MHQLIGFVGYYRSFIKNFAELSEPLVALTRKGTVFAWISERQDAFEVLKSCQPQAQILGVPTEVNRCVLDMDASLGRWHPKSDPGGSGGGDCLRQPESPSVSIFVPIFGVLSSLCVRIIGPYGGFQNVHNNDGMLSCWYIYVSVGSQ